MLAAGASGYILKAAETSDLVNAVRTVARGEVFLYPSMAKRLVKQYLRHAEGSHGGNQLTDREREILSLIAKGYTNREIADQLVISPSTVYSHRTNLMHKLNLSTRHELVRYARERGII
jgi:two-component system response regulator NreC